MTTNAIQRGGLGRPRLTCTDLYYCPAVLYGKGEGHGGVRREQQRLG